MGDGRVEIERGVRLSRAAFWGWQADEFARKGPAAWSGAVPFYVTSNPFIADRYARLIHSYLLDLARQGYSGGRVPIFELGAGSGQFGFYCVKRLAELCEAAPTGLQPLYVMTDIAEANVDFWASHPDLSRYIDAGILDLACFDIDRPAPLTLRASGEVLDAGQPLAGAVCIANYVFDSMRQDVFHVKDGRIFEQLVTTTAPAGQVTEGEPVGLRQLEFSFTRVPAPAGGIYPVPLWNEIVGSYAEDPSLNGAFVFPVAMLSALDFLQRLGGGRLMLIASDKGYQDASEIAGRTPPLMTPDGDFIFSQVNFDAIRRFVERCGGTAFHGAAEVNSLRSGVYLLGGDQASYPQAATAIAALIQDFGPGDYYNLYLHHCDGGELNLATMISSLRLSGWDPHLLSVLSDRLYPLIEKANWRRRAALQAGLSQAEALIYRRPGMKDYHFDIGLLRQGLQDDAGALRSFEHSVASAGETSAKCYHMGLALKRLGDYAGAITRFEQAQALDAENVNAGAQIEALRKLL